jgi:hypothetical protein
VSSVMSDVPCTTDCIDCLSFWILADPGVHCH